MYSLGRGPLEDGAYKKSKLYDFHFQDCFFQFSFFVPMFQTCDPLSGASLDHGHHLNNLVEVHKEMLHTKYQNFTPSCLRDEEF